MGVTRCRFTWLVGLLAGSIAGTAACAGSRKNTEDPQACMRSCEQEECEYVPDAVGDNTAYLQCLEKCEKKCS